MRRIMSPFLILVLMVFLIPLHGFADYGAIVIDGYYDDWEDKPHTEVYYDYGIRHKVSVFRDEARVYVHIKMAETGFTHIDNYYFDMETSGETTAFILQTKPIYGTHGTGGLEVYEYKGGPKLIGSGFYTEKEGESDEAEFYIELSLISDDPEGIYDISLYSPDLGRQQIMCAGVGTGPYVGVAVGAAMILVTTGYFYLRKKRPVFGR